jgi:hypothetical protein
MQTLEQTEQLQWQAMGLYEKGKNGVDRNYYRVTPFVSVNHRKGKLNTYGSASFFHRNHFHIVSLTE